EPHRIPSRILDVLDNRTNTVWVSAVSILEIAIKHQLHRHDSPPFSGHEAIGHFQHAGFALLDISAGHAAFVERLPRVHADPFDRLMLAQAIIESMQFVTYDRHLSRYDIALLTWS